MANPTLLKIRNFFAPVNPNPDPKTGDMRLQNSGNMSGYAARVTLERIRQDISKWRLSITEAEQAILPYRVRMQQMYIDTVLNGHVFACIQKRKSLSLLKDYHICTKDGITNEYWTEQIKNKQFRLLLNYSLESIFYGYSLINWSGIENNAIVGVKLLKRWHISPDRLYFGAFPYSPSGINFMDKKAVDVNGNSYFDSTLYVTTPSEHGISPCGMGLLYQVALYEIFMRNNLGYNAEFVEKFIMPMVWGKTSKTHEDDRKELENALAGIASSFTVVTDPMDDIQIIESKNSGTGYNAYDNFELRCEKKVSKILLGHADAIDSISGKLGSGQGKESEVSKALEDISSVDCQMLEDVVNSDLLPKLRNSGINIPMGLFFKFKNDHEKEEYRKRVDESNKLTAEIAKILKEAGLKMDEAYFTERTGIPVEEIMSEKPLSLPNEKDNEKIAEIQNKLNELYKI